MLPKFRLYGEDDPRIEETIQPNLKIRKWTDLSIDEKEIALQQMKNLHYINNKCWEIISTIEFLNQRYLRICPGKNLHEVFLRFDPLELNKAAVTDFENILLNENKEELVLKLFAVFAQQYIDSDIYKLAEKEYDDKKRNEYINSAYTKFDQLVNDLNHIFEQFAVNVVLTRNGLIPRQDKIITEEIYIPALGVLADPKWKKVNNDLNEMFSDYREEKYPEAITKAHRVVQRFLQILVGEEGKNGKGEIGILFAKAINKKNISENEFTKRIISVFQSYISSERATNSTAKPAMKIATSNDALLIMNVVMIFLQYCLQTNK